MGSDIQGVFQKQTLPGIWVNIETEYKFKRHYLLFGFIGGVRNGESALGYTAGQVIDSPLANRGLPDDMREIDSYNYPYSFINPYNTNYSWFLVSEYLDSLSVISSTIRTSVITKEDYVVWVKSPVLESGLRLHPNCNVYSAELLKEATIVNDNLIEIQNTPAHTHVKIEYEVDLKEEFKYFTNEMKRLIQVHSTDKIRFVYGFDN